MGHGHVSRPPPRSGPRPGPRPGPSNIHHHHHHHHHHHINQPSRPIIGYTSTSIQLTSTVNPNPVVTPLLAEDYKCVLEQQTPYQTIQIYQSPLNDNNNNIEDKRLVLSGELQFSTLDEKVYHNALIHVPMSYNYKNINNVLIIGGGDGGSLRELLKYKTINHIDIVEIDKEVIEICEKHFPQMASGFKDSRVSIIIDDAFEWVNKYCNEKKYDLIVVDVTEQNKTNKPLSTQKFWTNVILMLDDRNNGILIRNGEHRDAQTEFRNNDRLFVNFYECFIQSFGGYYCFTMISYKEINVQTNGVDLTNVRQELNETIDLSFSFPPDPQTNDCCCVIL